jgi:predicted component of type VI protein secretion system
MNRTLDETAALLGIKPRTLRKRLRELRILTTAGDLASQYRNGEYLYSDARSFFNETIQQHQHYAVVMVKEPGVDWLAKKLDVNVTAKHKDAAA